MAKQSKSAADPTRVANIAGQIRAAVSPVAMSGSDNDQAKENAKLASDAHRQSREGVFIVLADLSHTGSWTQDEIEGAAAAARAMSNAQDQKALSTFIGEAKVSMHPFVRGKVSALTTLRDLVWGEEEALKESDSGAATLFKDVFKRKQHMLTSMFNATRDGRRLDSASDMVAFARDRAEEQRLDSDKVLKKLKAIQSQLSDFYRDFPLDDVGAAISDLEKVDKAQLEAVKRDAVMSDTTTVVEDEPEVDGEPEVDEPEVEAPSEESEVTSTSTDPLQDALDDMDLHLAA